MAALNEREEFEFRLRAEKEGKPAVSAAHTPTPQDIPDTPPQPKPTGKEPTAADSLIQGAPEAALSIGTGMAGQGAGSIVAAVRELVARGMGADQGQARLEGQEAGGKVADAVSYQPRGEGGKKAVDTVGKLLEESKIAGLNPATPMGAMVPGAGAAARAGGARVGDLLKKGSANVGEAMRETAEGEGLRPSGAPAPAMPGVGSAETDIAAQRRARAAGLDVPISLSKGEASRDFDQLRFERETAKNGAAGKPIREHLAENNERILRNFDTWAEQTGADAPTLRATGQTVDAALVAKAKAAKARINAAYDKARASGEMEAPVSTESVRAYLDQNVAAEGTAKLLPAARAELARLEKVGGKPGQISINDMERLRQFIGENAAVGTPDMVHAPKLKSAIDAATEGGSGSLYKQARALRTQYAKEFEERAVVAKLLDTKGGDRVVALEDVFSHSILDGSLDDVRHLRGVLQTEEGPQGKQAWKELQGQTVTYIREQATKGVARDTRGNPIISPSGLDKAIKNLDADGKLEFVFGKKGAEQLRDLNDLAKDITAPPGVVNTSNTASVVMEGLKSFAKSFVSGKFGVVLKVGDLIKTAREEGKLKARVRDALEETQ